MACGLQELKSLNKRPMKHSLCAFAFHKHDFQSIYEHLTVGLDFFLQNNSWQGFPYCEHVFT